MSCRVSLHRRYSVEDMKCVVYFWLWQWLDCSKSSCRLSQRRCLFSYLKRWSLVEAARFLQATAHRSRTQKREMLKERRWQGIFCQGYYSITPLPVSRMEEHHHLPQWASRQVSGGRWTEDDGAPLTVADIISAIAVMKWHQHAPSDQSGGVLDFPACTSAGMTDLVAVDWWRTNSVWHIVAKSVSRDSVTCARTAHSQWRQRWR